MPPSLKQQLERLSRKSVPGVASPAALSVYVDSLGYDVAMHSGAIIWLESIFERESCKVWDWEKSCKETKEALQDLKDKVNSLANQLPADERCHSIFYYKHATAVRDNFARLQTMELMHKFSLLEKEIKFLKQELENQNKNKETNDRSINEVEKTEEDVPEQKDVPEQSS